MTNVATETADPMRPAPIANMTRGNSTINIGLMGLGTVGGGVAASLLDNAEAIKQKTGRTVRLKRALVRDLSRPRDPSLPTELLTTNPEDILSDSDLDIVVEVMGGDSPAGEYLERALAAGKHVVTANKEVMSRRGPSLLALAQEKRVNLLFEASAGGGIPIVGCLMSQLLANDTVPFVPSSMAPPTTSLPEWRANNALRDALAEAQAMATRKPILLTILKVLTPPTSFPCWAASPSTGRSRITWSIPKASAASRPKIPLRRRTRIRYQIPCHRRGGTRRRRACASPPRVGSR